MKYKLRGYPEELGLRPVSPYRESKQRPFVKIYDGRVDNLSPKTLRVLLIFARRLRRNNEIGERLYPAKISKVANVDYKTARLIYDELKSNNVIKDYLGVTFLNPNIISKVRKVTWTTYKLFNEYRVQGESDGE